VIRARMANGTFIFGIDAENLRRLRRGQPLDIDTTMLGGTDRVVIVYGETMQDILHDLERATGQKMPPVTPMPPKPPKGGH
jgi:hypothetical protein